MKSKVNGEMKKLFFFLLSLWLMPTSLQAAKPEETYQAAARLYKANQFEQAAQGYEKLLQDGYKTPEVYFNLGNCYYKLNQTAKSILFFERAAKLAPEDEDIQHNLKLAGLRATDKIQAVPQLSIITWWQGFRQSYSSGGWALMAVIFVWAALLSFAVFFFIGWKKITVTAGLLLGLLSFASLSLAFDQKNREQNASEAILMIANVFVKSAPDANGNDLFMIHEGVKFRIMDQVGTWYKIRLADGKVGWLEKGSFERI